MTSPLLLVLLLGAAQHTGQMSPTSDVSANRVKATGASTSRALRDWIGDVINVKSCGATGDGTTDDTAAIQACLDRLPTSETAGPSVLEFPSGVYRITSQLSRSSLQYGVLRARGNVTFLWDGSDATQSVLRFNASWRMVIDGFKFRVANGKRAAAAVTFGSYLGQHTVSNNDVYGDTDQRFDAAWVTSAAGGDANNDHFLVQHNRCAYVSQACFDIYGTQSKAHVFSGGNVFSNAQYAVRSEGSFFWYGGAIASTTKCDFWQKTPLNSDPILISGVNSENSKRLYCGGVTGFASEGNVATSNVTNENQFPVTLEGVRFDTMMVDVDGLESTTGGDMYVKFVTTTSELDGSGATVGWFAPVVNGLGGPLVLIGNRFGTAAPTSGARRAKVVSVASILGEHVVAIGNVFMGDDPSVSAIYGTRGGINYGPYFGIGRITALSNLTFKASAWTGGGAEIRPMAGQLESTGRSFWASDWDGFYGATYALRTAKDHHRIDLGDSITTLSAPDGYPGQMMTLEFIQDTVSHFTVSGWGSNFLLTSGPFVMPYANGASASITFRWDVIMGKWVEIARSGVDATAPVSPAVDGADSVGFAFDTTNNLTTSGAKLVSFRNQGVEKAYVGSNGFIATSSAIQAAGQAYVGSTVYSGSGEFWVNGAVRASVSGNVADAGGATGVVLDNRTALTNSTAKTLSVQNAGVEKLAADKDGHLQISIGNVSACPTCGSGNAGKLCYVGGGAGVADSASVCTKDAADAWAWRSLY